MVLSSSVNSFSKRACAAIQWGLDVWYFIGPFVYFHISCVRTAKALARLRGCAGSPEPSLVAYVISTIISWAGSKDHLEEMKSSNRPNLGKLRMTYYQRILFSDYLLSHFMNSNCKCKAVHPWHTGRSFRGIVTSEWPKTLKKTTREQGQCPVGHQTKPGPNPILLRLQQLAVVCSTEKNLSISVSSHLCHSQTVCSSGAHAVGCQMFFSKSKINVSTCPPLSKILAQSIITVVNWVSQLCLFF